jgi:tetratricopeptide (TPR) repeat protein
MLIPRLHRIRALRPVVGLAAMVWLASACGDVSARSLASGDRLLGVGELDAAIAEYKLAQRQRGEEPAVLLRLGHAYALRGDVDDALEYFGPLLEQDSSYQYQVAADLAMLAEVARERGATENMARALEPLEEWGLGFVPRELQLSLAHHYWEDTEYARSLALYLTVLDHSTDVEPTIYYEAARAYEELSGCERALELFDVYMSRADRRDDEMDSARWHFGNCLFLVADEDRAAGHPAAALEKLDRMVQLGVPRTYLDDAHFLRGEMLLAIGDPESALSAYRWVLDLNPARSGALVRRAEERIRQIRIGSDG